MMCSPPLLSQHAGQPAVFRSTHLQLLCKAIAGATAAALKLLSQKDSYKQCNYQHHLLYPILVLLFWLVSSKLCQSCSPSTDGSVFHRMGCSCHAIHIIQSLTAQGITRCCLQALAQTMADHTALPKFPLWVHYSQVFLQHKSVEL